MKKGKRLAVLAAACLMALGMTACGSGESASSSTAGSSSVGSKSTASSAAAKVSGKVTMSGSTSMEKFCSALIESLKEDYPDIQATAEYTGSGAGIEAVSKKTVDIGNSSRALKDEEKANGLEENVVAIDGIAVITDKNNTATNLTQQQLSDIYTGKITNWKDVGGKDEAIVVIGREAGSGTRGAFEELLKIQDQCQYAQEVDSTGGVMAKVTSTPGAIGYVSLDVIDDSVVTLQLDGVEATEENIKAGNYALSRPFVMATNGKISEQSEAVQAVFDFINSDKGQEVIKSVGLISAK